jgi:hypothetical protein
MNRFGQRRPNRGFDSAPKISSITQFGRRNMEATGNVNRKKGCIFFCSLNSFDQSYEVEFVHLYHQRSRKKFIKSFM